MCVVQSGQTCQPSFTSWNSRFHSRRPLISIWMLVVFHVLHIDAPKLHAQATDGGGTAYAKAIEQRARLTAEIDVLKTEQLVLQAEDRSAGAILQDLSKLDSPQLRERLLTLLDSNFAAVPRAITAAVGATAAMPEDLQQDLAAARNRLIADRRRLLEVSAQRQFTGQLASLFNVGNRWLWLAAVVAFGTLLGMIMHDRRQGLRRLLWVRRTRAVALVSLGIAVLAIPLLPTVLTFALGDQTYDALLALTTHRTASELGDDPGEQLKSAEADVIRLQETRHQLMAERQRLIAKRQQRLAEVFGDRATLSEDWTALREDVFQANATLLAGQAVSAALRDDLARVDQLDARMAKEQEGIESYQQTKRLTAAIVGGALLGMVLLSGWIFQRSMKARRRITANTCPRCLNVGSLNREAPAPGVPSSAVELRCSTIISETPYQECDFTFSARYAPLTKISFPTLGISQSGKTHWMAMTYQRLKEVKLPNGARLDRIVSTGSMNFDQLVRKILQDREGLHATTNRLPEPVVFEFGDRDPFTTGGNSGLVNLFDFAGTVGMTGGLHDYVRQRQLKSEGFLFFLDPTKPKEMQVDALLSFSDQIKQVKELAAGRTLHTPVALCVSKIDRTVYQDYAQGGDVMTAFFDELNDIDSQTKPWSLTRMRRRSELVGELRDTIWTDWDIEDRFRQVFGDRFLFFPMSPVGLPPRGVTDPDIIDDLSQRMIEPYGILEPLLWLLHMNGYPVLSP